MSSNLPGTRRAFGIGEAAAGRQDDVEITVLEARDDLRQWRFVHPHRGALSARRSRTALNSRCQNVTIFGCS